jgi:hypothetical protein
MKIYLVIILLINTLPKISTCSDIIRSSNIKEIIAKVLSNKKKLFMAPFEINIFRNNDIVDCAKYNLPIHNFFNYKPLLEGEIVTTLIKINRKKYKKKTLDLKNIFLIPYIYHKIETKYGKDVYVTFLQGNVIISKNNLIGYIQKLNSIQNFQKTNLKTIKEEPMNENYPETESEYESDVE